MKISTFTIVDTISIDIVISIMHRLKRNIAVSVANQEVAPATSNAIYDYIEVHELETDMVMETSLAYQIKKADLPRTLESATPNVIYDTIDEQGILSSDIAMEVSPAYQAKAMVTGTTES